MKTLRYPEFPAYSEQEYTELVVDHPTKFGNSLIGLFINENYARLPSKPYLGAACFEPKMPEGVARFSWAVRDKVFLFEKYEPVTKLYTKRFWVYDEDGIVVDADPEKWAAAERLYNKLMLEKGLGI